MSIGRNTLSNITGAIIPLGFAIFTIPYYISYIGVEQYGVLAVLWAVLQYFGFFDFGLGRAVTQRMSALEGEKELDRSNLLWTAIVTTFLLGVVGSIILSLISNYLVTDIFEMNEASKAELLNSIYWLLIALPLLLLTPVLIGSLQSRGKFIEINSVQITGGILSLSIPLVIASCGYVDLEYLVPATLAGRLFITATLYSRCIKHVPLVGKPLIDRDHLIPMLKYGGWVSVVTLMAPILLVVDRFVIAAVSGAAAVTHYTVPQNLITRTMILPSSLSSAIFPKLASSTHEDGMMIATTATSMLAAIMTPLVIAGLFTVHFLLEIWMGNEFAQNSRWVAEIILVGIWFNALAIPHYSLFLAKKDPKFIVAVYLFEIPIYLLVLFKLSTDYGIIGAAAAWSFRMLMDTAVILRLSNAMKVVLKGSIRSLLLLTAAGWSVIFLDNMISTVATALALITFSLFDNRSAYHLMYRKLVAKRQ